MTAPNPSESTFASRRTLLTGAVGGLGALLAGAFGRVSPARAADGDTVHVGDQLSGANTTKLTVPTAGYSAFWGNASASSGSGVGVRGDSAGATGKGLRGQATGSSGVGVHGTSTSYYGVVGISQTGIGVYGSSSSSNGVYGTSQTAIAIYGLSSAIDQPALRGQSSVGSSTGVQGVSGAPPATARPKTGVHGLAAQDSSSKGVWGESPAGHGVHGSTTSGYAGYFAGKVYTSKFHEMTEIATPAPPAASNARLFVRNNASGKTQLCVRFNTGALQVLATQP